MVTKDWKKTSKTSWSKKGKVVSVLIPRNVKHNYIVSLPGFKYMYYPNLKNALKYAKSYMRKH